VAQRYVPKHQCPHGGEVSYLHACNGVKQGPPVPAALQPRHESDGELARLYEQTTERPGPAVTFEPITADSSLRERFHRNTTEQFARTNSTTHHSYRPRPEKQTTGQRRPTTAELEAAPDLRRDNDTREAALLARLAALEAGA